MKILLQITANNPVALFSRFQASFYERYTLETKINAITSSTLAGICFYSIKNNISPRSWLYLNVQPKASLFAYCAASYLVGSTIAGLYSLFANKRPIFHSFP